MFMYSDGIKYFAKLNIILRYENEHTQNMICYMFTFILKCFIVYAFLQAHISIEIYRSSQKCNANVFTVTSSQ